MNTIKNISTVGSDVVVLEQKLNQHQNSYAVIMNNKAYSFNSQVRYTSEFDSDLAIVIANCLENGESIEVWGACDGVIIDQNTTDYYTGENVLEYLQKLAA